MTDEELKKMWLDAGGDFHGPNIETGTMPESSLIPFLRDLLHNSYSKGIREGYAEGLGISPVGPTLAKQILAQLNHVSKCNCWACETMRVIAK